MVSTPDLFDRIARHLIEAKQAAVKEGRVMYAADLASTLRTGFPSLQEGHGMADSGHDKAIPSDFGDRKRIPPTPEQVTAYSASIGFELNGADFCDFYESKGWVVGKAKMKDWQAACRTWKRSGYNPKRTPTATQTRDYSRLS